MHNGSLSTQWTTQGQLASTKRVSPRSRSSLEEMTPIGKFLISLQLDPEHQLVELKNQSQQRRVKSRYKAKNWQLRRRKRWKMQFKLKKRVMNFRSTIKRRLTSPSGTQMLSPKQSLLSTTTFQDVTSLDQDLISSGSRSSNSSTRRSKTLEYPTAISPCLSPRALWKRKRIT